MFLFLAKVYLLCTLRVYMSKGWAKVADELKAATKEEDIEDIPIEYEKINGGPTGIHCDACGEEYYFTPDFHPRGGRQLVPAHRCLTKGGGMIGMKRFIRDLS